jgi:hypothetical protein
MYPRAPADIRQAIVSGLFGAKDDDGLIRIADMEKDPRVRAEVLRLLRLLGTPRAEAYLEKKR